MASTITDMIERELDPTTVANALYELMLEWYQSETVFRLAPARDSGTGRSARRNAAALARWIGRFLQVDEKQARELLLAHYELKRRTDVGITSGGSSGARKP